MEELKNKTVFSFLSTKEFNQIQKRLLKSLFFYFIVILIISWLVFLYFNPNLIVIKNITILDILTLKNFSFESIAIICVLSTIFFPSLIIHFYLLLITSKNNLSNSILIKKSKYIFCLLLSFLLFLNGFLILYYIFAIYKFFIKTKNLEKTKEDIISQIKKDNDQIKIKAQKSLDELHQKKLIKSFDTQDLDLKEINIKNKKEWEHDSSINLKKNYPEIISTKDLNSVIESINESEKELKMVKNSANTFQLNKSKQVNEIESLINLKQKIFNTAIKLKDLQEKEIQQSNHIIKNKEFKNNLSSDNHTQFNFKTTKNSNNMHSIPNEQHFKTSDSSKSDISSCKNKHNHSINYNSYNNNESLKQNKDNQFQLEKSNYNVNNHKNCCMVDYKEQYKMLKAHLNDLLQKESNVENDITNSCSHLHNSIDYKNQENYNENQKFIPNNDDKHVHQPNKNLSIYSKYNFLSSIDDPISLRTQLENLKWDKLITIANDLKINTSFKKREIIINDIISKQH